MSPFFDYNLPEHLIAQHPTARRDESRLLVVRCAAALLEHRTFRDLPDLLTRGDLLVRAMVEVPTRLNAEQRAKLQEFADLCGEENTPLRKSFFERAKEFFH